MSFFDQWLNSLLFIYGAIGAIVYILSKLKSRQSAVMQISISKLQSSLAILVIFIILATFGFTSYFLWGIPYPYLQFVNNVLTSVVLLYFLFKLWKSISFRDSKVSKPD